MQPLIDVIKKRFWLILQLVTVLPGGLAPLTAVAQPAPNARPEGGQVVAGTAQISKTTTSTRIDQSSQRAAIDWPRFDVGSGQRVEFNQPSASAVTLNRVVSADPSQIAGKITANGSFVLVNQAGVVFTKGAQVDAQSVIVSASGITNQNFMAGRMVFDQQALPNAQIVNDGRITVKQTGLAALVAPQVKNSGMISAKLGHVVLAGAETHTLDLYGDGLLSFDVTGQIKQAPIGKDGTTATTLVTNSGVIRADGGSVLLTAAAVEGVVQNLVTAGGKISTPSLGGKTGRIVMSGIGGALTVEGTVAARGRAPGTTGGQIQLASTGDVVLAPGARVDASGQSGGGTAAIGTTLARATGGPSVKPSLLSRSATIKPGATVAADATGSGRGGNVTVLSAGDTTHNGSIFARGGPAGGDGGAVEISGKTLGLSGTIDAGARAPGGAPGTLLLDPDDIIIVHEQPLVLEVAVAGPTVPSVAINLDPNNPIILPSPGVTPGTVSDLAISLATADITIAAAKTLTVNGDVVIANPATPNQTLPHALTLQAGGAVTVLPGASIAAQTITIQAGAIGNGFDHTSAGNLTMAGKLFATTINLSAGGGNMSLAGGVLGGLPPATLPTILPNLTLSSVGPLDLGIPITAGVLTLNSSAGVTVSQPIVATTLNLNVTGAVTQSQSITAALLQGTAGSIDLTLRDNAGIPVNKIDKIGKLSVTGGFSITQTPELIISGGSNTVGGSVFISANNGIQIGEPPGDGSRGPGQIIAGPAGSVELLANGPITEVNGSITAPILSATSIAGSVQLNGANVVGALRGGTAQGGQGPATVTAGTFSLTNTQSLSVVTETGGSAGVALNVTGNLTLGTPQSRGLITSQGPVNLNVSGDVTAPNGSIAATTLSGTSRSLSLTGLPQSFPTLGNYTAPAGIAITSAGNLVLNGNIVTSDLHLDANGTITRTGGTLQVVGSLSGSAVQLADFGANAQIGTLGAFSVTGSVLALDTTGPLTIDGPLSAEFIRIQARDLATLAGTITTQGLPLALQSGLTPAAPGSFIVVLPGRTGTGRFTTTGNAAVVPSNGSPATLRIAVPGGGGQINFNGLTAERAFLVLDTGTGGQSQGLINVQGLLVLGQAGGARLFGTVNGSGGFDASLAARIEPRFDPVYTLNGCPIGVSCQTPLLYPPYVVVTHVLAPDHLPPLLLVAVPQLPAPLGWMSSPDIVPPNISRTDY